MKQSGSDNRVKLTDKLPGLKAGENILVFFDSMWPPVRRLRTAISTAPSGSAAR